jgi:hypothetical protein
VGREHPGVLLVQLDATDRQVGRGVVASRLGTSTRPRAVSITRRASATRISIISVALGVPSVSFTPLNSRNSR